VAVGASPDPRFEAAVSLALRAGRVVMGYFASARVVWKDDDSMVTDADLAVEDFLVRELGAAFPDDIVLGEERGATEPVSAGRHVWVIDPIDGTNNFGRGMPGFAVSIGVLRDGLPRAGVVHDPLTRQLFAGSAGAGATLNGRPLRMNPAVLSPRSLFSIRAPYAGGVPSFVAGWLGRYRLRRPGSTALALCYIATGALAFVHDHGASLWDIAGAAPVLLEAGGVLTDPMGADIFPIEPHGLSGAPLAFLAGDPIAHHESLADIRRG
jgi:myo-inositol-1(or 4)-monophosphatase